MTGPDLLVLDGVGKAFGGLRAVDDVSLRVAAGSITSIIGPNGAGKTSLFNLISGVYRPSSGRILFDSRDLSDVPTHALAGLGIGRTFQNLALFRQETVIANLLAGCHAQIRAGSLAAMLGLPRARRAEAQARADAEEILALLDLVAVRDTPVGSLAYGVQKRVELGRALATRPRLLLLDELVSGMNVAETAEISRLVLHVNRSLKTTVVMIEHDMNIVMDLSDRVCVLHFGKRIAEGTPEQIAADPAVIEAYLGVG
jgi:branched-chain amino acid transport system ATP-binding protein